MKEPMDDLDNLLSQFYESAGNKFQVPSPRRRVAQTKRQFPWAVAIAAGVLGLVPLVPKEADRFSDQAIVVIAESRALQEFTAMVNEIIK